MIAFACPRCKTVHERPADQIGSKFPCSNCGQRLQVPDDPLSRTVSGDLVKELAALARKPTERPAPAPARAEWYYQHAGLQAGPVSWEHLRRRATERRLGPDDLVWKDGTPNWVTGQTVSGLFPTGGPERHTAPAPWQGSAGRARAPGRRTLILTVVGVVVAASGGLGWAMWKGKLAAFMQANLTAQQIFERHAKSVAVVRAEWNGGIMTGSGFLVRPGLVATNAHVLGATTIDQYRVYFPSAGQEGKVGKQIKQLVFEDRKRDLAILAIDSDLPPVPVADHYQLLSGQNITVIGSPGIGGGQILENTVSSGVIGTQVELAGQSFYQLSISINPGNSGGPVFAPSGKAIGVVTLKATRQEGIAYGVPEPDIQEAIRKAAEATKDSAARATSRHNLEVVFRRVAKTGNLYVEAMGIYNNRLQEAVKNNKPPADGIQAASKEIGAKVKEIEGSLLNPVRSSVKAVTSDELTSEMTRLKVSELWTLLTEMKEQIDTPRGAIRDYVSKNQELAGRHKKLVEAIQLIIGSDDLD